MEVLMGSVCALVLVGWVCFGLLKWNGIRHNRRGLPPGTMGWPFFGETTEFLKQGPDFMKNKRARFGSVFKSHILGSPTIVSMDPELNRYILLNEGKGLVPGYPQSTLDILGKSNIAAVRGSDHKRIRGSFLSLVNPSMLKDWLLPRIDKYMRLHLNNLDSKTIDIQKLTANMALFIAFKQIMETESSSSYEAFKAEFDKLMMGSLSLPINIPGTNYYGGFMGGLQASTPRPKTYPIYMGGLVLARGGWAQVRFGWVAGWQANFKTWLTRIREYKLNDDEILDQVIMILYSGFETISTTSMMAIKYLHDHPTALQELRDEHFAIRGRKKPEEPIEWNDYKTMSFTRAVTFETLRLATVVNGVLRKTTEEMELNGFVIPRGWRIYVYTREINYNPFLYPEPLKFNPWRWLDKSMESQNYCFLFGGGSRLCPGKELGIVIISTFLHYFVTQYRWEEVGGEKDTQIPES
ncbi:brassinosteroid-6-oxidase 1 [Actinidia rufa]|uniref:Brassinosteroid-6-oxidase 1 n=1 Tax=Actinidia rufa TaxID=165716 RepID=A0A7J0EQP5_9ERIC|nr:brassinosteroid-6-oxidase 1 [Actinidia rufa]